MSDPGPEPSPWATPDAPATPDAGAPSFSATTPRPTAGTVIDEQPDLEPAASHGPPDPLPPLLRPMTAGDAIDGSFALLRARPRAVLGVAALFVIPLQVVAALVLRDQLDVAAFGQMLGGDPSATLGGTTASTDTQLIGWVIEVAMGIALTFVCATYALLLASWYGGSSLSTGEALRQAVRRAPSQVGAWLLVHLVAAVALCTFVGGIFIVPFYLVLAPAIAVERLGPIDGIRRAWFFGTKRYAGALVVSLLSGLVATLLSWGMGLGLSTLGLFAEGAVGVALVVVGNSLAGVLGTVAVAGATALFYLEARVRLEGLDLVLAVPSAFDE